MKDKDILIWLAGIIFTVFALYLLVGGGDGSSGDTCGQFEVPGECY